MQVLDEELALGVQFGPDAQDDSGFQHPVEYFVFGVRASCPGRRIFGDGERQDPLVSEGELRVQEGFADI